MPNRIIKESICYSDDIDKLNWFEEVVFYRLIVRCDDNGRLDARASFLRSMLFATKQGVTDRSISDAVNKLVSIGLVELYEVDAKPLLLFPKWGLHQRIRNVRGKYPAPNNAHAPRIAASCGDAQAESESESESKTEAQSNQKERACTRHPTAEEVRAYCKERKNAVDPARFVDFYCAKGWKIGKEPMHDWKAAVRTWERREGAQGAPSGEAPGTADRRTREDMERMRAFLKKEKENAQIITERLEVLK